MRFTARCAELLTQGQIRWSIPLSPATPNPRMVNALARALMAGDLSVEALVSRAGAALGREWRWLRPMAQRYVAWNAGRVRPRRDEVVQFLLGDRGFCGAIARLSKQLAIATLLSEPQEMQPVAAAAGWNLPAICSVGALADWLYLSEGELEWFADLKGIGSRMRCDPKLRHYHYRVLAKDGGSVRLIEAPKERLKEIQRRILRGILDWIPVHPAVHWFCEGRSIRTFVAPHVGKQVVLRMDLQDFFPSFAGARIQAFFRTAGYPEMVADRLGGLVKTATPGSVWKGFGSGIEASVLHEVRALYARPHLPQGAPTSPALANVCAYRMDCRLSGLARRVGASYTRYADDLAFSGDAVFARQARGIAAEIAAIAMDEGFTVNHRKTRVMGRGVRQSLAGLVANERVNVARDEYDLLKAILHNCVRFGAESQNREGHASFRMHLLGRVGFVESIHPEKGARLRRLFEQIVW
jgi:RNA-directed DNA polymerase